MIDSMKKLMLAGVGVLSLTREKAEQIMKELVEKGQVSVDEAKGIINHLVEKGEQEKSTILQLIRSELSKFKDEMGFVTKKDYRNLEERISRLEAQLGQAPGPTETPGSE